MARKGILSTDTPSTPQRPAPKAPAPRRGAVGALQSSLTKLQEAAVQDIEATLIDDAGVEDRLGRNSQADKQLVESLRTYGQQVPVLLRPHPSKTGRFEIVYGRRRLRALKELGLPVRAMIRQLDDQDLIMAQGQENTSRQDLSFIEKASFAAQLDTLGYERQTICDALSIDLPMVSRMLKIGHAFDIEFLKSIGSAPGIGRDRWAKLAKAMEDSAAKGRAVQMTRRPDFLPLPSDDRFEACLKRALEVKAPKAAKETVKPRPLRSKSGIVLGDVKRTAKGVTLNLQSRMSQGFELWFEDNAEAVLADLHDQWQKDRSEDNEQ